ncbi:UTP---glucose-1-phosphate uridylyltransferase [Synchytrium microbalum]|uniref:UTP--glucose-1-phosphate uridylyltransferase n=1 Tax=Synchytrium microbalum TaxID=1806994 RepID=A0A507BJH1_9FUNG|nr:UTP---glucose-1-phosphate uridylyltransferase [Synchytrium microbalum]TPX30740.1 UTP---glucose-1-phosphate uridylyltransferase [Synchytrium microbalum]
MDGPLKEYILTHCCFPNEQQDFHDHAAGMAAKSMRNELNDLVSGMPEDHPLRRNFSTEMDNFYMLFTRYLNEKSRNERLNWAKVKSPAAEQLVSYSSLEKTSPARQPELLSKLAVLKLNGGLGTTMGCVGPKSAIEVRDGLTFLDLTVRQIEYLNNTHNVKVPLILMNSFNTDNDTQRIINKYAGHGLDLLTFNQSKFPRIIKESSVPMPKKYDADITQWYPPGHGDVYEALDNSGLLDQLLAQGKEYLFVSNVDNLGATVDTTILQHMMDAGSEFIMEVTDKTKADIKGGTLIDYEGNVRLLEVAQVPSEHMDDFKSIKKFKIFNTNNLWISLKAIRRNLDNQTLNMEIIVNTKTLDGGEKIIQLETAAGAAIKHFKGGHGVNVPRARFLPVKSTSDLFLITSDLYSLSHGELNMNPKRQFGGVPVVKLGDHFKKVQHFLSRFAGPPHILELDHLTVTGDVSFGHDVILRGTVIIVANHGSRIDIPSGSVLDDKVVTGNLRILDH